jgi:hypothetical protein
MNNRETESNESRLMRVLREARPEPALPPRFQESVWRRIEREDIKSESAQSRPRLDQLVSLLLSPRWAIAGVVAMLVLGGIIGVMDGSADARQAARDQYVASVAPHVIR